MIRPFIDGPIALDAQVPFAYYNGQQDLAHDICRNAKVYLNGKEVKEVVRLYYDAQGQGWIDQYKLDKDGKILFLPEWDDLMIERHRGRVGAVDPRMFTLAEVYLR